MSGVCCRCSLGPNDVLVTIDLDLDAGIDAAEAAAAIGNFERQVRACYPMIKRLFIESGSAPGTARWLRQNAVGSPAGGYRQARPGPEPIAD